MIFPDNKDFTDFFDSLNHEEKEADCESHVLFESNSAIDVGNIRKLLPDKRIYLKNDLKISLKGIQKKVDSYLKSIGHVSNIEVVNSIIYMLSFVKKDKATLKTINNLFENSTTADLNQFLIYPIENSGFSLNLNEFSIGTIDKRKIKNYCHKFSTDYYNKYSELIDDKFGITRKHFSIKIFNTEILANSVTNYNSKFIESMFTYFDEVSKVYQNNFYSKFSESQEILNFLTDTYFDPKQWSIALSPSNFISIYLNIAKKNSLGWIVPKTQGVKLNIGSGTANKKISELKREYNFINFGSKEIDIAFKKFVSFCAKGSKYITEERVSESFLHYVIALDLLFGDKDSNTSTVSNRTAFLCFQKLNLEYNKTVKIIKEFYDLRSKYVHEGRKIKIDNIDRIKQVCLIIFEVYLRLNNKGVTKELTINNWLKKIDLGVAHLQASEELSLEFFEKCGIE